MTIDFKTKILKCRVNSTRSTTPNFTDMTALQFALESDRGRIINSASVRRLQQKTQVFPLERNAAVRSRLTHSMEVQQVGRFIVQTIFRKLTEEQKRQYGLTGLERATETLVEMACLLHDIGNPPFGHAGESAINNWFSQNLPESIPQHDRKKVTVDPNSPASILWQQFCDELCRFEGNAQGIRLVSSLQQLNLNLCQIACILKYTRPAAEPKPDDDHPHSYLKKKPGYYVSESELIEDISTTLNIAEGCRFPLTYIMEAADDISYCLADIEDAVEKKIFSLDQLSNKLRETYVLKDPKNRKIKGLGGSSKYFSDIIRAVEDEANKESVNPVSQYFISLRVAIIHPLVTHAADQFIEHINQVYTGNLNRALIEDGSECHAITETFKEVALKDVFSHKEVETLELQGFRIIAGLLDTYQPLLQLDQATFAEVISVKGSKKHPIETRLARKLPDKYLSAYKKALAEINQPPELQNVYEFYYRCRLLQDFISGMTDHFAFDEYQTLVNCRS